MAEQKKHMHTGHRSRLKSRFKKVGLDGFEDHEVLEYLLTFAIPHKDVNPLAHRLIDYCGSLNGVLESKVEDLVELDGVGEHTAALLTLIPQLSKRYLDNPTKSERLCLKKMDDRRHFFCNKFIGETSECVYAAFLDAKWNIIACLKISSGSVSNVNVESDLLIKHGIRLRARMIMIAHNHFGSPEASSGDVEATKRIEYALENAGLILEDHLIVCGKECNSLEQHGVISHVTY